MATIEDTEDFSDDDLDADRKDTADEDRTVDVDVDDDDGDDEATPDVENLMRQTTGPTQSARRRVENYLEMKRAAKDLSDLEDFNFD